MSKKSAFEKEGTRCSFCGRPEDLVEKLIAGTNVYICDRCIKLCSGILDKKPVKEEEETLAMLAIHIPPFLTSSINPLL